MGAGPEEGERGVRKKGRSMQPARSDGARREEKKKNNSNPRAPLPGPQPGARTTPPGGWHGSHALRTAACGVTASDEWGVEAGQARRDSGGGEEREEGGAKASPPPALF